MESNLYKEGIVADMQDPELVHVIDKTCTSNKPCFEFPDSKTNIWQISTMPFPISVTVTSYYKNIVSTFCLVSGETSCSQKGFCIALAATLKTSRTFSKGTLKVG